MTKYLTALIISLLSLGPLVGKADERGDMTLGLNGGFTNGNHSGYAGLYFRYSFAKHIRIQPSVEYVFKHKGQSAFDFNLDMQFPFRISKGFHVYPLGGMTFNTWDIDPGGTISHFGGNAGAGFDLNFTSTLKVSVEAKYSFMVSTPGVYIGAGIGYNF